MHIAQITKMTTNFAKITNYISKQRSYMVFLLDQRVSAMATLLVVTAVPTSQAALAGGHLVAGIG